MSPTEWGVTAVAVVAAIATVRAPRPWLTLVAVVGALVVLALGTPRWQLVPAGLALGLLAVVTALQLGWPEAPTTLPRVTAVIVVLGLLSSAALAWALPVPRLELATGSRPVGSVAFDLVDEQRTSPSSRDDGPRATPVQAWYPTGDGMRDGPRLEITDEPRAFARAVSQFLGVPAFALTHLGRVRTAAIAGARPVDERLPVIVSIHGWGGFRFAQAPLLEQLAADGHLVLAMDHTHAALAAQPASGGVVPLDPRLLPADTPPPVYDAAAQRLERTFADDVAFLLEALRSGDAQIPASLRDVADLDRLVVIGHSTGGGAAALLCAEQPCAGMITFDPWVEPVPAAARERGFGAPTLVLLSGAWTGNDNDQLLRPMVAASDDARLFVLEGTTHNDVTVQAHLSPLSRRLGIAGSIAPERLGDIVLAMTRSWIAATTGTGPGDASLPDDLPFPEVRPG